MKAARWTGGILFAVLLATAIGGCTLLNTLPVASMLATPTQGEVPLTVVFDAWESTDSDGTIRSYRWDFGDGESDRGVTVEYTYPEIGSYIATLTVRDNAGGVSEATQLIEVTGPINRPPTELSIDAAPTTGFVPLIVSFIATATDPDGTIESYAWEFGDGATRTGPTVAHTYIAPGTYQATLTVTDDEGATATETVNIQVSLHTIVCGVR